LGDRMVRLEKKFQAFGSFLLQRTVIKADRTLAFFLVSILTTDIRLSAIVDNLVFVRQTISIFFFL
jgi:hypothetical protein